MKKANYRLRVLSPTHIGNGNELTPVDFYPANGRIYVLDTEKLISHLMHLGVKLDEILDFLKSPLEDLYVWRRYINKLGLNIQDFTKYALRVIGNLGTRSSRISEFIKTRNRPYIPGSSIKGAIRTAILYKVLKECSDTNMIDRSLRGSIKGLRESQDLVDYYLSHLEEMIRRQRSGRRIDPRKVDDHLEAIVFGWEFRNRQIQYEPKRDPMKALIIRDSDPIPLDKLAVYKVEILGNILSIPTWVEAVIPETKTKIEIVFDKEALKNNAEYFNGVLWECLKSLGDPWDVFEDFVWDAVNDFYRNAIIREEITTELRKYGNYANNVKSFYQKINNYNGFLLRLGWGSGWISTTIGILLRGDNRWESIRRALRLGKAPRGRGMSQDFPKTKKVASGLPMGWVVVNEDTHSVLGRF